MKYSLPFNLKAKPLNHYFNNGVVRFAVGEGKLYYFTKMITRTNYATLTYGIVKSKEHLDRLLSIKSLHEIPTIEEVVS